MTISGIDVSNYQGPAPDLSDKGFIIIKATEGTSVVNAGQEAQAAHARAAGLVVGFYHFLWPGDIQAQAEWFVTRCASVPGDVLACDWETTEDNTAASCAEKDAFLAEVNSLRPGHKRLLYCNREFWTSRDTTSDCGDGLWIADPDSPAGHPAVEHPWLIHQYGTAGGVDRDVANFASVAAMKTWADPAAPKPPAPTPVTYEPFPGAAWFHLGRVSPTVGRMHKRLVAEGCNHYRSSVGQDIIGSGDVASYEAWQRKCGFTGAAAKWPPGQESWDKLKVPKA
jgi:GH25 family lysozyme M1 (1,4-beta-N-acetylmuramidase)